MLTGKQQIQERLRQMPESYRRTYAKAVSGKPPMQTFRDSLPLAKEKVPNQTVQTIGAMA